MVLGTIALLAAALGGGLYLGNRFVSNNSNSSSGTTRGYVTIGPDGAPIHQENSTYGMSPGMLKEEWFSPEAWELFQSLPEATQQDFLNRYISVNTPTGLFKDFKDNTYDNNIQGFVSDLEELYNALEEYNTLSEYPDLQDLYSNAMSEIEAENAVMNADLDALLAEYTDSYNDQLQNISSNYNNLRRSVIDQQYAQNAQLMDTFNANLDRSRRNAIESGASAGIRIADNINQLLSVQNKQATTAMDTANQLAQMMVNQRNAEASARGDYLGYKAQDTANRHSIMNSTRDRASNLASINYENALSKYNNELSNFETKYNDNLLYDQVPKFTKNDMSAVNEEGKPKYNSLYSYK